MKTRSNAPLIITLVSIVLIFALLFFCIFVTKVSTGEIGIVTRFGAVTGTVLDPGIHLKSLFEKVIKIDTRIQRKQVETLCFSSDTQEVSVKLSVNYQIPRDTGINLYTTIGKNFVSTVIEPNVLTGIKEIFSQYTAEKLISNRGQLGFDVQNSITNRLESYGINIVTATIEDIDFTDSYTDAIEAKQVATQEKLRAETVTEQQKIEAQATAEIRKINAEAEAYEIKVKAEAEAEANRIISESINSSLLDYKYYEVWDGKLPVTMLGSDTNALVTLP